MENTTVVIINNSSNRTLQLWQIQRKCIQVLLQTFWGSHRKSLKICLHLYFGQTKPVSWFMLIMSENPIPEALVFSSFHLEFILRHWLVITGQCPDHPAVLWLCYLAFAFPSSAEVSTLSCCLVTVKLPSKDTNTLLLSAERADLTVRLFFFFLFMMEVNRICRGNELNFSGCLFFSRMNLKVQLRRPGKASTDSST